MEENKTKEIKKYERYITLRFCSLCDRYINSSSFNKHKKNRHHMKYEHRQLLEKENNNNTLVFDK